MIQEIEILDDQSEIKAIAWPIRDQLSEGNRIINHMSGWNWMLFTKQEALLDQWEINIKVWPIRDRY